MNMKVHDLSLRDSVFNQYMAGIRDINVKTDHLWFGRDLERVGEILAYEKSKTLTDRTRAVSTGAGGIDRELTPRAYIVPGLGDVGDLAYGDKS